VHGSLIFNIPQKMMKLINESIFCLKPDLLQDCFVVQEETDNYRILELEVESPT
jgi:hypothetical protein